MVSESMRARRQRVVNLMNAISDLKEGDLNAELSLDRFTPLKHFGPTDRFKQDEHGKLIHIPGDSPAPRSLIGRVEAGETLGKILESHLASVLVFGEVQMRTEKKPRRTNAEIGGRRF